MDTREFLGRVLGTGGYFCLFGASKKRPIQKFYGDKDTLISAAEQMDSNGVDAYFGLATYQDSTNREATNTATMKSFFLDLDCGPNKPYETQKEALQSLQGFVKSVGLPKPIVVSSGYGVHVYWELDTEIPAGEWVEAAERLKELTKQQGLQADPAITADVARILRVPGTNNYKRGEPKAVRILNPSAPKPVSYVEFVEKLPPVLRVTQGMEGLGTRELLDTISQKKSSNFAKIMRRSARGEGCAQLAYVAMNQDKVDEPMWRGALSIAAHCEDADTAIHKVSSKHPQYSPDETETKAARVKGPYLCSRFDDFRPGVCKDCQFWGKIKSPIVLGTTIKEATDSAPIDKSSDLQSDSDSGVDTDTKVSFDVPTYPQPFYRTVGGGVAIRVGGGDETEEILVYPYDLYMVKRLMDPALGECTIWRVHMPQDGIREFMVPASSLTSRDELRKAFSAQGVVAVGKELELLMRYSMTWVKELQQMSEAAKAHVQFGWSDADTLDSFLLGNREYFADRVEDNPPAHATEWLFGMFEPRGTLEGWKKTVSFFNRTGCEAHQFVLGLSFGAPLMAMTPYHGVTINLHSMQSGHGKSSALMVGASVWAHPPRYMMQLKDTMNAMFNRMEIYRNTPFFMDEVTNMTPEEVSDCAYQVSQGYQKARMESGSNRERGRGDQWALLNICSSNASLLDKLATYKETPQGEAARLLEYHTHKVVFAGKEETDKFSEQINKHTGWAGPIFIRYVMKHKDKVAELMKKIQDNIDNAQNLEAANRYYSYACACALTSLTITNQLGLTNYDLKRLRKWIIYDLLRANLESLKTTEMDVLKIINDFIHDHHGSFLRIGSGEVDETSLDNPGMESLLVPDKAPINRMVGRYETDTYKLYILPSALRKWCAIRQIHYKHLEDQLRADLKATIEPVQLNRGLGFRTGTVNTLTMKLDVGDVKAL